MTRYMAGEYGDEWAYVAMECGADYEHDLPCHACGVQLSAYYEEEMEVEHMMKHELERLEALTPEEWRTTYTTDMGDEHEAIQIPWRQVRAILGRPHEGCADDDWALVDALLDLGMPAWIRDASGWVDEYGWAGHPDQLDRDHRDYPAHRGAADTRTARVC